jgi:homoserine/homoserine lactone efflux protein
MPIQTFLAYMLACIALLLVPGPMVSLIIANSLRHGSRAGLLNMAGSQVGQAVMLTILLLGLNTVMTVMGAWFDWIRIAGAIYLIWLGIKMVMAREEMLATAGAGDGAAARPSGHGFFWQGIGVSMSNPKLLLFFGAFIPQFIDTSRPYQPQVLLLVVTFMVLALLVDGGYAILAGQAGGWVAGRRRVMMSRASGAVLIGGGLWLALLRR